MATSPKTDYLGLATTGLEIHGNSANASNQNLEVVGANAAFKSHEKFGSIKSPHCEYKITDELKNLGFVIGKVHGTNNDGPYALRSIQIHTGAGDEPTFAADGVQIQSGATKTLCTFTPTIPVLTPARHAITFGAFTYEETADLSLQSSDYTAEAEIDPVTINGVPKAADAIKGYEQVAVTMWTNSDTTAPSVQPGEGWFLFSDWDCSGSDGQMFVWTATYKKYLTPTA